MGILHVTECIGLVLEIVYGEHHFFIFQVVCSVFYHHLTLSSFQAMANQLARNLVQERPISILIIIIVQAQ